MNHIFLNAEVVSGLGEDTFWTWMLRELPCARLGVPDVLDYGDVVLHYSTLGEPKHPSRTIALLWELHHEMRDRLCTDEWNPIIAKIEAAAASSRWRTTPTLATKHYYERFGAVDIVPIGVDCDVFHPGAGPTRKAREELGLPLDKHLVFWSGTRHRMKGHDRIGDWLARHPEMHLVVAWKHEDEPPHGGATNFWHLPQAELARVMRACHCFLSPGHLRPWFMVEWEALACGLEPILLDEWDRYEKSGIAYDAEPSQRDLVLWQRWDRDAARTEWFNYIERCSSERTS